MRNIKTFEAYGEPEKGNGKQFRVIKKGKGVMPSTYTPDMISTMWKELLIAKDFDGVPLSTFLDKSILRDTWENNNIKLICVEEETSIESPIKSDQFRITIFRPVSKRKSTFDLNEEDLRKTYNSKYNKDGLERFIDTAKSGDNWKAHNIEVIKL